MDEYKELKVTKGKAHNYLGMVLEFFNAQRVIVRQQELVEDIVTKAKST